MEEEQENGLIPSTWENNAAPIHFLDSILTKASGFVHHFDAQTSILVGISSVVFFFVISRSVGLEQISVPFIVLGVFSGLSTIVSLYAMHPPSVMRKKRQEESLLYNKKVVSFPSEAEYQQALYEIMHDHKKLLHQYTLEIYNLYKYYYRPKRTLFIVARNTLLIGILLSLLTFAFPFFV